MILNDVLKSSTYDKLIVQRIVYNSSGLPETYGWCYADNTTDQGWAIYDSSDVWLDTEVTGFMYDVCVDAPSNLPDADVMLTIYTPIVWTLCDGAHKKTIEIRDGYQAFLSQTEPFDF